MKRTCGISSIPLPEIPRPLPLTETDSEDEKKKVETPASKPIGSARHKPSLPVKKDELPDLCDPQKAIHMYPATKGTLNETRNPCRPTSLKRTGHNSRRRICVPVPSRGLSANPVHGIKPCCSVFPCLQEAFGNCARLPLLPT